MRRIRWGILGTGNIAQVFAADLSFVQDSEIVAVGSRREKSAEEFGRRFGLLHRHASYEALACDPEVDVVYIATPHVFHKDNMLLCLDAGKHVLCEKPFTLNAQQATEAIALARQNKKFLMEAMWTRFLPIFAKVRELISNGLIGDIRMFMADFGVRFPFHPESRLFNPELGGGALLDLGVYPVSLASMLFGTPTEVTSLAHLGETGVDEQSAMLLKYSEGQLAILSSAMRIGTKREALIFGTGGYIKIHAPFHGSSRLTLVRDRKVDTSSKSIQDGLWGRLKSRIQYYGKQSQLLQTLHSRVRMLTRRMARHNHSDEILLPITGNGLHYQATEVAKCIRTGKCESETMSLEESVTIMATLDGIREQWGLKYPYE